MTQRSLAALVAACFFGFACASAARGPLDAARPDLLAVRKVVELRVDDGSLRRVAEAAAAVPRRVARAASAVPRRIAAAAHVSPVRANPCGGGVPSSPSPSPSGGGGSSHPGSSGGGGSNLVGNILIGLLVTVVFGLFIWGASKLWRSIFPAPPVAPTAHEPGRVLALIRLAPEDAMARTATDLAGGRGLEVEAIHRLRSTDDGLLVFSVPDPDADLAALVADLETDDRVHLAQLDYWFDTTGASATTSRYDDPYADLAWGPELIGAGRLHARTDGSSVRVAIIDTGVDASHRDFGRRVVEQLDTTGEGLSADLHGTALAGAIAAAPGDGFGTWGVAPGVEIVAAKACHPLEAGGLEARCWSSTLARGIDFSIRREARVLNLSVAGPSERLVTRMVHAALRRGAVVVAAAGNGGPDGPPLHPGALPEVLTVTAIDADDDLYAEATTGEQVDVAAPGVEIVSDAPDGTFPALSGTSLAAAHVTGAAALLLAVHPELSAEEVKTLFESTAHDLGKGERDDEFGSGRIDVCAATERLSDGLPVCQ